MNVGKSMTRRRPGAAALISSYHYIERVQHLLEGDYAVRAPAILVPAVLLPRNPTGRRCVFPPDVLPAFLGKGLGHSHP